LGHFGLPLVCASGRLHAIAAQIRSPRQTRAPTRTRQNAPSVLICLAVVVPALICPWGPVLSMVLLNTTHGRTGYSLPLLGRAGVRHTSGSLCLSVVPVIVPPCPKWKLVGTVGWGSLRHRRLLQCRIGISLCKCSLCDWCAVGLMRPTVARGEAIADAWRTVWRRHRAHHRC
jgi:hypothetical protein